ncbi:MAG: hypothetical protein MUC83_03495 [Pirellula sp.]|nr:hypothetical protein [Pirellula sp.]
MNHSNVNGSAASPENLSLSAVPPANGRRALYLCAASLIRVGQFCQAERVCHDLLAHSVRYMDGKNYYAARRLLCTLGTSNDSILGSMDGRPRFLLEADSRVQFDLFCANEELCSSRWENARFILQSLCSSLEQEVGLDEYTSFAFGWLATSIRKSWRLIRNASENQNSLRELNALWAHSLENSEIAATHFEWELPLFCRESAWQHVLTNASIDPDFVTSRLLEGAGVCQNAGMIREEHECLAAWQDVKQLVPGSIPDLPEEWQARWNCLARQFSPLGGEQNPDEVAFEGILGELNDIQNSLQQCLIPGDVTPPKSSHLQRPALAP